MAARTLPEKPFGALGVVSPPPIHVETAVFAGSLGTLFSFVRDHKVDLMEIPLFPICEAYFAYMLSAQVNDLDEAAAALSALAYLLERKAWMLLPVPEVEPDYEEPMELDEPTSHEYRLAIEALALWQEERSHMFFRSSEAGPDLYELPYTLHNVSGEDLARAMQRLLAKATPETVRPLNRPRRSLSDHMKLVLLSIGSTWRSLEMLLTSPFTREDVVYWFLGLLELMRLGQVQARFHEEDVQFSRA